MPPARLCVFSISSSVVGGKIEWPRGLQAPMNSSTLNVPRAPVSVNCTPALAAEPPVSCHTAWLSRVTTTSSPGRVSVRSATWLAMVPLGSHSAASLPSRSATASCSRLVVGSSPNWSSPTAAGAIAARIAVGRPRDGVRAQVDRLSHAAPPAACTVNSGRLCHSFSMPLRKSACVKYSARNATASTMIEIHASRVSRRSAPRSAEKAP